MKPSEPSPIPSDWPDQAHSECHTVDGIRWHCQRQGHGPTVLLLHGTGGSTHSWAAVTPRLADGARVVSIDLPGHGFTHVPPAVERAESPYSIPVMARRVAALLRHLGEAPRLAVGHSAGAAVLLRLALDGAIAPDRLIGVCPALVAPPAWYVMLMAPLVRTVAELDLTASGAARLAAGSRLVRLLLATTGSPLTELQHERYRRLCSHPGHVHAALAMMARWDLPALHRDWYALRVPLHLIAARGDAWIPIAALERAVQGIPGLRWQVEEGGHLIPEERPEVVLRAITGAIHP